MDNGLQSRDSFPEDFAFSDETKAFWEGMSSLSSDMGSACQGQRNTLPPNISAIEKSLRESADYRQSLALAKSCPIPSHTPWAYQSLIARSQFSIGFLTIFRINEIPLHDHPESFGIQLLLDGNIQIDVYRKQESSTDPNKLVRLIRQQHHHLKANQYCCFTPEENIHNLVSQSERSVLLSIISPPIKSELKSWYYPVNPFFDDPEDILAYRSKRRGNEP